MTQANPIIGPDRSGIEYRMEDNDGKQALLTHHKGPTAPTYAEAGTIWLDDHETPWKLKIHDGSEWIVTSAISPSDNTVEMFHGAQPLRLLNYAVDMGAANAYAVNPVPPVTAYQTGMMVTLKPAYASTGACTLNVNALGAKNIRMPDGSVPQTGTLSAGSLYLLFYDGTQFILMNGPSEKLNTWTPVTVRDDRFTMVSSINEQRRFKIDVSGVSHAETRIMTVPDGNFTAVGAELAQTLSQKTLDNTTSMTIKDANLTIVDDLDVTKRVQFQLSALPTGVIRTYTAPNLNGTLALTSQLLPAAQQGHMELSASNTLSVTPLNIKWAPGVAKFWAKVSGDGTSILGSHNVESISDIGAGDLSISVDENFSMAHWCCGVTVERAQNTLTQAAQRFGVIKAASQTSGVIGCLCLTTETTVRQLDPGSWHIFGLGVA